MLLRRYFYSGWAFLIPYLLFYLLYYWRKWPVNPLPGKTLGDGGHIPALLHVYWALHGIHLVLGLLALHAWWKNSMASHSSRVETDVSHSLPPSRRPSTSGLWPVVSPLLPWLLLALIFYIPGVYLEWPSDPWQHYARIHEWADLVMVGDHSTWNKSSYFFTYSLVVLSPANRQFIWLDIYYTGICLLLCWQYFRLALTIGMNNSAATIFVLLQTLLFGNDVFGFYRYYGIASTILSQLGAVALIRIGLHIATGSRFTFRGSWLFRRWSIADILASSRWLLTSCFNVLCRIGEGGCLVLLIAFDHAQGLGIAALGLLAVAAWRLTIWKRAALWFLLAAALLGSFCAVHWWPRNPALDQAYRPQGWLTCWYAFNIFSPRSPAWERGMQILGAMGVVNLLAGILLICRNHVVGWLTILPPVALALPLFSIPIANAITAHSEVGNLAIIFTFHRLFFAIPAGLAMICFIEPLVTHARRSSGAKSFSSLAPVVLLALSLLILTSLPANDPCYNRFWNSLATPPDDLSLKEIADGSVKHDLGHVVHNPTAVAIATPGIGYALAGSGINVASPTAKWMADSAPALWLPVILADFSRAKTPKLLLIPSNRYLFTPASLAGTLSGHWSAQEAAIECAGGPELALAANRQGAHKIPVNTSDISIFKK